MFPKLFQIGDFIIPLYGPILAVAYLTAIKLTMVLGKKEGIPSNRIFDIGLIALFFSILGAKLMLVIVDFGYYWNNPKQLILTFRSGGVFYGGFILALVMCLLYIRKHGLPLWKLSDAAAPSVALGQSIGRIGCFAAGCCYGKECDLPWAVTFTNPVAHKITGVPLHRALHPTQLYMSLAALVLFGVLMIIHKRRTYYGQVLFWYMLLYGIDRFVVEYFRGDPRGFSLGEYLSVSQMISIVAVSAGIVLMVIYKKRNAIEDNDR